MDSFIVKTGFQFDLNVVVEINYFKIFMDRLKAPAPTILEKIKFLLAIHSLPNYSVSKS